MCLSNECRQIKTKEKDVHQHQIETLKEDKVEVEGHI